MTTDSTLIDPARAAGPTRHALRILIADDTPTSLRYLSDALTQLGACVSVCADGESALRQARDQRFDLLLLDYRMPGAHAHEVLVALRQDTTAASHQTIAVASSADIDADLREQLLAYGFQDILDKPCTLADLKRVLTLAQPADEPRVLNDHAALLAVSQPSTMRALRGLLLQELLELEREWIQVALHDTLLDERLHRLRAACGFCGASLLAARTATLHQQLGSAGAATALADFRHALQDTVAALRVEQST